MNFNLQLNKIYRDTILKVNTAANLKYIFITVSACDTKRANIYYIRRKAVSSCCLNLKNKCDSCKIKAFRLSACDLHC